LRIVGLNCRFHQMARNPPAVELNRGTSFLVGTSNALRGQLFFVLSHFLLAISQVGCRLGGVSSVPVGELSSMSTYNKNFSDHSQDCDAHPAQDWQFSMNKADRQRRYACQSCSIGWLLIRLREVCMQSTCGVLVVELNCRPSWNNSPGLTLRGCE
jgi:hypothetical protein